ncbi:uncharacterized protein EV420DRAFT_1639952 [Desarmillaria tabescens]|uniref:MARVEL domain-containing protein n=1 Tax=Armillaria tabescens TaxID=1929756 RepID=A0AA39N9T8_ARMTA|nr:uncharacterized protein EV420DRAFT_1639952 [Desarmillaria tabescens]KAK0461658.1 hypothetical protein EV420DRAFT_1639952 [Desarmillaria tabescens]
MSRYSRSASFVITLFGIITNSALAIQVLAASRSIKWEPEFEWETSNDTWRVDGVKVVWGLLLSYFVSAATVCAIGFVGVVKSKPSFVRFYRDYSIADFSFCTIVTVFGAYGAFRSTTRTGVCEELSRQPELMRDLGEMGLSLENCERWFERAVMAFVACMVIVIVARLHFLLAVSNYYSHVSRHASQRSSGLLPTSRPHSRTDSLQRVLLLPRSNPSSDPESITVYAPVSLKNLTPELRQSATEAWVRRSDSHRHTRSQSNTTTGRITLPIRPNEGLLPPYYDDVKA